MIFHWDSKEKDSFDKKKKKREKEREKKRKNAPLQSKGLQKRKPCGKREKKKCSTWNNFEAVKS